MKPLSARYPFFLPIQAFFIVGSFTTGLWLNRHLNVEESNKDPSTRTTVFQENEILFSKKPITSRFATCSASDDMPINEENLGGRNLVYGKWEEFYS